MIGKVNDDFFKKAILPCTGAFSENVVIGPRMGVDAAVLKVADTYMAIAEDPIFPGPTTSPEDFGWITVHIGASDVAVMGLKPEYMTYSLLLPPETTEEYIAGLVGSISRCACQLGITIVGGHTGYYGAVNVPTIGGTAVWGFGKDIITPAGAKVGDSVIITKGAAIEAAALIACELRGKLENDGVKPELVERAAKRFREISVVEDAAVASRVGGVHAMHDATEGGLARGLWEVAQASGVGMRIEREAVMIPEDIRAVCGCMGLNPYEIISEGTLVLTCSPDKTAGLVIEFGKQGIEAARIGEVVPAEEGILWIEKDGGTAEIMPPPVDRFWEIFFSALSGN